VSDLYVYAACTVCIWVFAIIVAILHRKNGLVVTMCAWYSVVGILPVINLAIVFLFIGLVLCDKDERNWLFKLK